MRITRLAAVVVLGSATNARAERPEEPDGLRWEGGLALRVGSLYIDGGGTSVFALQGSVGVSFARLAVFADYADGGTSAPDAVAPLALASGGSASTPAGGDGNFKRLGGRVRYTLARSRGGLSSEMENQFWIEAGVGRELITWDAGGVLGRNDATLGFGGELGGTGEHHHGGLYFDLTAQYTQRIDRSGATCGGPCDVATPPPGLDRSVMFDLGVAFGGGD